MNVLTHALLPRRTGGPPAPRGWPSLGAVDDPRFAQAIAAIDAANEDDPNELIVDGRARPKELAHAEMVSFWVDRLRPDASVPLRLAARAHHIRRWEVPRSSYPEGRAGYLRWRRLLYDRQAEIAGKLVLESGYDHDVADRVRAIVGKRDIRRDKEVQVLEDALCLVFLETQFAELAARTERSKMVEVTRKTLAKMSTDGVVCAGDIVGRFPGDLRAIVEEALAARG